MEQLFINKKQRVLACSSYIGVVGLFTYVICRFDNDKFILEHAKNSSIIFMTTILAYPVFVLISRYYFYYLSSYLGLVLLVTYITLFGLKLNGVKKAFLGKQI